MFAWNSCFGWHRFSLFVSSYSLNSNFIFVTIENIMLFWMKFTQSESMLYFNLNIGNSWEPPHYFVKVHSLPKVIQNSRELLLMYETNKFQNDLEVKGYSNISWYKGGGSRIVPLVIDYRVSLFEEKVSVFICKIFRLKRNEEEVSWITGRVVWTFRNWRITPTRSDCAKKILNNYWL